MQDSSQVQPEFGLESDRRERLFRVKNRLSHHPGDMEVIREYVDLLLEVPDSEDTTSKLQTYDHIEAFLLERAEEVDPGEVDTLLDMASSLDERRKELVQQSEVENGKSGRDQEVTEAYGKWKRDGIDFAVPEDPEEARRKLSLSKEVHSFARDQNREMIEGLSDFIEKLESATRADELFQRFDRILESVEENVDSQEATYLLQSAERMISQLVTTRDDLGGVRRSRIVEKLEELEDLSDRVTKRQQQVRDQRRWEEFLKSYGEKLEELEEWDIYGDWYRFEDKRRAKTKKDPRSNKPFTSKINQMENMLYNLSKVSEKVKTKYVSKKVESKIEEMETKLNYTKKRRKQTYNEFAMARIRKCLSKAEDATGTIKNDKKKIAHQMVNYLAEVDQRYLTSEVGRCYSEAFEYLYGKLKRAKGKDDFEEEGRKLNVLKRMHERETIGIDEC